MKYFIVEDNIRKGPFSFEELTNQNLNEKTLIWHKGLENWVIASKIEKLNTFLMNNLLQFQK